MSSDEFKKLLISYGNTFAASFILGLATTIYTIGHVEWTFVFWASVVIAGFRAGVAAVVANFVPVRLGGKRL